MSSNSGCNHTHDKQIRLPLRDRPILLSLVWLQTELDSTQSYYHTYRCHHPVNWSKPYMKWWNPGEKENWPRLCLLWQLITQIFTVSAPIHYFRISWNGLITYSISIRKLFRIYYYSLFLTYTSSFVNAVFYTVTIPEFRRALFTLFAVTMPAASAPVSL